MKLSDLPIIPETVLAETGVGILSSSLEAAREEQEEDDDSDLLSRSSMKH